MIDPKLAPEEIIKRQERIIEALMHRVERGDEVGRSHFGIFQSAIALQHEVQAKTERLENSLRA